MEIALDIILFIGAIAFMILIHEFGHFSASKAVGVEIEEFGLGFPPRALTLFEHKGTKYTLNWIPLGGFVRPKGEEDSEEPGGMAAAAPWKRLVILIAGPLMNIGFAILIYSVLAFQTGVSDTSRILIGVVSPDSPAEMAGLQAGDFIDQVNTVEIHEFLDIQNEVNSHLGELITLTIDRAGETSIIELIPRDPPPEDGAIGVGLGYPWIKADASNALPIGFIHTVRQSKAILSFPFELLFGDSIAAEEGRVVGYKGMYDMYDYMRDIDKENATAQPQAPGGYATFSFFAIVTLSLGLFNLLPIPALDGGRIIFVLAEIVFRKRIPQRYENVVHLVGFVLLITLMIYVNLLDFIDPIQLPGR